MEGTPPVSSSEDKTGVELIIIIIIIIIIITIINLLNRYNLQIVIFQFLEFSIYFS